MKSSQRFKVDSSVEFSPQKSTHMLGENPAIKIARLLQIVLQNLLKKNPTFLIEVNGTTLQIRFQRKALRKDLPASIKLESLRLMLSDFFLLYKKTTLLIPKDKCRGAGSKGFSRCVIECAGLDVTVINAFQGSRSAHLEERLQSRYQHHSKILSQEKKETLLEKTQQLYRKLQEPSPKEKDAPGTLGAIKILEGDWNFDLDLEIPASYVESEKFRAYIRQIIQLKQASQGKALQMFDAIEKDRIELLRKRCAKQPPGDCTLQSGKKNFAIRIKVVGDNANLTHIFRDLKAGLRTEIQCSAKEAQEFLDGKIHTIHLDITTIKVDIKSLKKEIEANKKAIKNNSEKISNVDSRVTSLEKAKTPSYPALAKKTLLSALKREYRKYDTLESPFPEEEEEKNKNSILKTYVNLAIVKESVQKKKEMREGAGKEKSEKKDVLFKKKIFHDALIKTHESIYATKEWIEPENLFKKQEEDRKHPKHLLIFGRAGIGKTTLCRYIVIRWQDEKNPLWAGQYDAVFLIRLRDMASYAEKKGDLTDKGKYKALADIIKEHCLNDLGKGQKEIAPSSLITYLKTNASKILFLLDGYDEIAPLVKATDQNKNRLNQLLTKLAKFPNLIVTSRPHNRKQLEKHFGNKEFDRVLENIGFTNQNVEAYIESYYKDRKNKDMSQGSGKLLNFFKSNPSLWGTAHVPIMLALMCFVYSKKKHLTESLTMTDLYKELEVRLFERYFNRSNELLSLDRQTQCRLQTAIIEGLGEVALYGMVECRLILDNKKIDSILKKISKKHVLEDLLEKFSKKSLLEVAFSSCGFLKPMQSEKKHYFLHLTFQEFFAARFIAQWFSKQRIIVRKKHFSDPINLIKKYKKYTKTEAEGILKLVQGESFDDVILKGETYSDIEDLIAGKVFKKETVEVVRWITDTLKPILINEKEYLKPQEFIKDFKVLDYFEIVWLFVAGLLKKEKPLLEKFFNTVLKKRAYNEKMLLSMRCLEEGELPDINSKNEILEQGRRLVLFALLDRSHRFKNILHYLKNIPLVLKEIGLLSLLLQQLRMEEKYSFKTKNAIIALGELGAIDPVMLPQVLDNLLQILVDNDCYIEDAAKSLGSLCSYEENILKKLVDLLGVDDLNIRRAGVYAIVEIAEREKRVVQYLLRVLKNKNSKIKNEVLRILGEIKIEKEKTEVLKVIFNYLKDDETLVNAIDTLSKLSMGDQTLEFDLLEKLINNILPKAMIDQDNVWKIRGAIARVCGRYSKNAECNDIVLRTLGSFLLKDNSIHVKREALYALTHLDQKDEIIRELLCFLRDGNSEEKALAIDVIQNFRIFDDPILNQLLFLFNSPDLNYPIAMRAIETIGMLGVCDTKIYTELLNSLQKEERIRFCAAQALYKLNKVDDELLKVFFHLSNYMDELFISEASAEIFVRIILDNSPKFDSLYENLGRKNILIRNIMTMELAILEGKEEKLKALLSLWKSNDFSEFFDGVTKNIFLDRCRKDSSMLSIVNKLLYIACRDNGLESSTLVLALSMVMLNDEMLHKFLIKCLQSKNKAAGVAARFTSDILVFAGEEIMSNLYAMLINTKEDIRKTAILVLCGISAYDDRVEWNVNQQIKKAKKQFDYTRLLNYLEKRRLSKIIGKFVNKESYRESIKNRVGKARIRDNHKEGETSLISDSKHTFFGGKSKKETLQTGVESNSQEKTGVDEIRMRITMSESIESQRNAFSSIPEREDELQLFQAREQEKYNNNNM